MKLSNQYVKCEESDEERLQKAVFDVVSKVEASTESVPAMYEGMKCYQFEIEVKKAAAKQSGNTSYFGDFFKKFTN